MPEHLPNTRKQRRVQVGQVEQQDRVVVMAAACAPVGRHTHEPVAIDTPPSVERVQLLSHGRKPVGKIRLAFPQQRNHPAFERQAHGGRIRIGDGTHAGGFEQCIGDRLTGHGPPRHFNHPDPQQKQGQGDQQEFDHRHAAGGGVGRRVGTTGGKGAGHPRHPDSLRNRQPGRHPE